MSLYNCSRIDASDSSKDDFEKSVIPFFERDSYKNIYIVFRWPLYLEGFVAEEKGVKDRFENGIIEYERSGEKYLGVPALTQGLEDTIEYFAAQKPENIYILLSLPENHFYIPPSAAILALTNSESEINKRLGVSMTEYNDRNKAVKEVMGKISKKYAFVKFIDPAVVLLDEDIDRYKVVEHGKNLYYDDDHLSIFGARKLMPLFANTFVK